VLAKRDSRGAAESTENKRCFAYSEREIFEDKAALAA
jgi:hypothetical protein